MNKIVTSISAILLAGCATHPDKFEAAYVSPMKYQGHNCDQVAAEAANVERRVVSLHEKLRTDANRDAAQMVGGMFFWPFLFTLEGGDGPRAAEYKALKGEYVALEEVSVRKKCGLIFKDSSQHANTPSRDGHPIDNEI